eukprot:6430331-Amphidinium_carterae.1
MATLAQSVSLPALHLHLTGGKHPIKMMQTAMRHKMHTILPQPKPRKVPTLRIFTQVAVGAFW